MDFPEPEEPMRKVSSFAGRKRERESSVGLLEGEYEKVTLWRASSPIHLEGEILRRRRGRLEVGDRGGSFEGDGEGWMCESMSAKANLPLA